MFLPSDKGMLSKSLNSNFDFPIFQVWKSQWCYKFDTWSTTFFFGVSGKKNFGNVLLVEGLFQRIPCTQWGLFWNHIGGINNQTEWSNNHVSSWVKKWISSLWASICTYSSHVFKNPEFSIFISFLRKKIVFSKKITVILAFFISILILNWKSI